MSRCWAAVALQLAMPHIITCPTGLTGSIRGLKVREERFLADRKLAKSGAIVDEFLRAWPVGQPNVFRKSSDRPRTLRGRA